MQLPRPLQAYHILPSMQVSQKNCPAIMIPHFLILGHIKGFLHEFAWTSYYFMFHLSGERVLTFMLTVVNKSVSNQLLLKSFMPLTFGGVNRHNFAVIVKNSNHHFQGVILLLLNVVSDYKWKLFYSSKSSVDGFAKPRYELVIHVLSKCNLSYRLLR